MAVCWGLPKPYLVPAYEEGHEFDFNELYYWDSYFMVQGLLDDEHRELVMGILENLPSLTAVSTDYPKYKELLAACVVHAAEGGMITKTKLAVLAYLADFTWYHLHGTPMTGATYRCLARGPVADEHFRAIDELYEAQAIAIEPRGTAMLIRAVEQTPSHLLQENELSLIHGIGAKWRSASTEAIINFAREQAPCKAAKPGDPIPYEAVLNAPKEMLY